MKGLIIKDITVMLKQMGIFLILLIIFAAIPSGELTGFAVMYTALLPITAVAYDERSKWDELAAMMPYSPAQLVLCKYLLSYALVAGACVISLIARAASASVTHMFLLPDALSAIVMYVCISLIIVAIDLPIMFGMGSEKGRFVLILITIVIVLASVNRTEQLISLLSAGRDGMLSFLPAAAIAAAVLNAVSIFLSSKLYRSKHR